MELYTLKPIIQPTLAMKPYQPAFLELHLRTKLNCAETRLSIQGI